MKLTISRSKNSTSFYVHESYRNEKGHSTTRVIEKLGTAEFIKSEYGVEDPDVKVNLIMQIFANLKMLFNYPPLLNLLSL